MCYEREAAITRVKSDGGRRCSARGPPLQAPQHACDRRWIPEPPRARLRRRSRTPTRPSIGHKWEPPRMSRKAATPPSGPGSGKTRAGPFVRRGFFRSGRRLNETGGGALIGPFSAHPIRTFLLGLLIGADRIIISGHRFNPARARCCSRAGRGTERFVL